MHFLEQRPTKSLVLKGEEIPHSRVETDRDGLFGVEGVLVLAIAWRLWNTFIGLKLARKTATCETIQSSSLNWICWLHQNPRSTAQKHSPFLSEAFPLPERFSEINLLLNSQWMKTNESGLSAIISLRDLSQKRLTRSIDTKGQRRRRWPLVVGVIMMGGGSPV